MTQGYQVGSLSIFLTSNLSMLGWLSLFISWISFLILMVLDWCLFILRTITSPLTRCFTLYTSLKKPAPSLSDSKSSNLKDCDPHVSKTWSAVCPACRGPWRPPWGPCRRESPGPCTVTCSVCPPSQHTTHSALLCNKSELEHLHKKRENKDSNVERLHFEYYLSLQCCCSIKSADRQGRAECLDTVRAAQQTESVSSSLYAVYTVAATAGNTIATQIHIIREHNCISTLLVLGTISQPCCEGCSGFYLLFTKLQIMRVKRTSK